MVILLVALFAWKWVQDHFLVVSLAEGLQAVQKETFTTDRETEAVPSRTIGNNRLLLCYSVVQQGGSVIHHVSGSAPRDSQKFLMDCMVQVMAHLVDGFKMANLTHEPRFVIAEMPSGAHHIEFSLTPEDQEKLRRVVFSS